MIATKAKPKRAQGHPIISCYGETAAASYPLILIIGREPDGDEVVSNTMGTYELTLAYHHRFRVASYALAARTVVWSPTDFQGRCRQLNGSPLLYAHAVPQGVLNSTPATRRSRQMVPEASIRQHVANMFGHSILEQVKLVILSGLDGNTFDLPRDLIVASCAERRIPVVHLPLFSSYNAKRIRQELDPKSRSRIASIVSAFRATGEAGQTR